MEEVCLMSAADPGGDVSLPIVISDGLLEWFSVEPSSLLAMVLPFAESVGG